MKSHLRLGLRGIFREWVLVFGCVSALCSPSIACSLDGRAGILPENSLRIESGAPEATGVDHPAYDVVLDQVEAVYSPIVEALGGHLVLDRAWEDSRVNSYASRLLKQWHVQILGGLARYPGMTPDALALVACHELGHHLGGVPRFFLNWASVEGEADYFATLKCLRQVLVQIPPLQSGDVPDTLTSRCQKAYASPAERSLCERSGLAGLLMGRMFGALGGEPSVSLDTPDPSQSWWIQSGHPGAQCRLDTYLAGALCPADPREPLGGPDGNDPTVGACSTSKGDTVGVRPLCWYRPGGWIL